MSNKIDGCPRISTEILISGTQFLLREQTRILNYYKHKGVIIVYDNNLGLIRNPLIHRNHYKQEVMEAIKNELSFESICKLNIQEWKK